MGEMTIRGMDEETLAALRKEAERRGVEPEEYARLLLRSALPRASVPGRDRAAVARAILATQAPRPDINSVDLLREDRESH